MAEANANGTPMAVRLATQTAYIVDLYHSSGHVGMWCSQQCMPGLEANQALLGDFPTNICETMNSELSPLAHTVHHMGRWVFQLSNREMVDVLNMKNVSSRTILQPPTVLSLSCYACPPLYSSIQTSS